MDVLSSVIQHQYSHNSTLISTITPTAAHPPFYYVPKSSQFSFISDKYLNLAAPVVTYWVYCSLFHWLDTAKYAYFEKRRIHESPEVLARNKVTFAQVLKAVVVQHTIQICLGWFWMEGDDTVLDRQVFRDHVGEMADLAPWVADAALLLLGRRTGEQLLKTYGERIVRWVYWWGIPAAQMFFAFFVIDTWQYFWHRAMHNNRWLYRNFHSHHHRLYVSYAFGALYNHPVEGFILDSCGAVVAEALSGMSLRQATLLFTVSTIKTVDDHCGYRIWWDPCQMFFNNNADYHDIHHQAYGIKSNFSQPFFTNWDKILGTQMTREQADSKTRWKKLGHEYAEHDKHNILAASPSKKID
ncbi:C4-hydroxylase [Kwoniella heveanensis BCC8398]|uniref:C4-hydroxylase n=1 Tax=Kwoniella heveanensis BCC8398 TaxID=1296120 RepID=A0A1B9GZM5_9TREE|nr:C4-hydroxylase [Kwoniella heveanensis BCC8398]